MFALPWLISAMRTTRLSSLCNLGGPNSFGVLADAMRDFYPVALLQFFKARLIGLDVELPSAINHSDFYEPLLVAASSRILTGTADVLTHLTDRKSTRLNP